MDVLQIPMDVKHRDIPRKSGAWQFLRLLDKPLESKI